MSERNVGFAVKLNLNFRAKDPKQPGVNRQQAQVCVSCPATGAGIENAVADAAAWMFEQFASPDKFELVGYEFAGMQPVGPMFECRVLDTPKLEG